MRSKVGFRAELVAALMLLGACAKEQKPAQDAADLVIKNARIYTVDASFPWATSLAIDGGKIAAVGIEEQVAPHIGANTRVGTL